jgi:hypothetical protein
VLPVPIDNRHDSDKPVMHQPLQIVRVNSRTQALQNTGTIATSTIPKPP